MAFLKDHSELIAGYVMGLVSYLLKDLYHNKIPQSKDDFVFKNANRYENFQFRVNLKERRLRK